MSRRPTTKELIRGTGPATPPTPWESLSDAEQDKAIHAAEEAFDAVADRIDLEKSRSIKQVLDIWWDACKDFGITYRTGDAQVFAEDYCSVPFEEPT